MSNTIKYGLPAVKSGNLSASLKSESSRKIWDKKVDVRIPGGIQVGGTFRAITGVGALLLIVGGIFVGIKTLCKKFNDKSASANNINEGHESAKDKIDVNRSKTDDDIRKMQAASDIRMEERLQCIKMKTGVTCDDEQATPITMKEWIDNFHSKHQMPDFSEIPFINTILRGCPCGFREAILLSTLSECGALCFSKVRAEYGNRLHSPSILTIVEGTSGSGKGNISILYKRLFGHIQEEDQKKVRCIKDRIVQTAGIRVTAPMFMDILSQNKGVHIIVVESEIATVQEAFKQQSGLSMTVIRNAFDNDSVSNFNKGNGSQGLFPVYMNAVFSGTPDAIARLFNKREIEGGSARRFCFAVIPELDAAPPQFNMLQDKELNILQKQINAWRSKYCYTTYGCKDTVCSEQKIDLSYLNKALDNWILEQYRLFSKDGISERNAMRTGIATIAFHCGIVLHMMVGENGSTAQFEAVKDMVIYIANYCMERYLYKFSRPIKNHKQPEFSYRRLTDEEVLEWYPRRGTFDSDGNVIGLCKIAKTLGTTKDAVRNAFVKYEKFYKIT